MADDMAPAGVRAAGLLAGPLVALLVLALPPPPGLSAGGSAVAAVAMLMAIWWMTEAVPLAATALLPVVLFPVLGIAGLERTTAAYAHPLLFLFLGGFVLAAGVQRTGLHARIAGLVAGGATASARRDLAGLMAVTAFLSMWVSNTAAAMVMLPVAAAVAGRWQGTSVDEPSPAATAMMLAVAYAATIGGMATLVGTPPNALFAAYMQSTHGITIGFAEWLALGLPTALLLLAATWLVLTRLAFRLPSGAVERRASDAAPSAHHPLTSEQRRVAVVLGLTALAWVTRPQLAKVVPAVSDAGIAVAGALALLAVPLDRRGDRFVLAWSDVAAIRWDVLILVGGGLALAEGISATGLDRWIGSGVGGLQNVPLPLLLLLVMAAIVLLGELASNTAIAALFLPVAGAAAAGLGVSPLALALPVALAASLGFMLPVATPPNAIVYGSGLVPSGAMLRAGALLDVIGVLLVAGAVAILGPLLARH
jgi:sodium-dependent dicarboxylate transporter 2/3/5